MAGTVDVVGRIRADKGFSYPDETIYSTTGNARKVMAALAARTVANPVRLAGVGDSVLEYAYGFWFDKFGSRLAVFNDGRPQLGVINADTGTGPFAPYQFKLTTGTAGTVAGDNNYNSGRGGALRGYRLGPGAEITLRLDPNGDGTRTDEVDATPMFDRLEVFYSATNVAGTHSAIVKIGSTDQATINTVDGTLATNGYESGRLIEYSVTRGQYTIKIRNPTASGAGNWVDIDAIAVWDGASCRHYNFGHAGFSHTSYATVPTGHTRPPFIDTVKNLQPHLIFDAHGINDYNAGDQAAATAFKTMLTDMITACRSVIPDVSYFILLMYAAASRANWPLFQEAAHAAGAETRVPVCDASWMFQVNAATTDPSDLALDVDPTLLNHVHTTAAGGHFLADRVMTFIFGSPFDWGSIVEWMASRLLNRTGGTAEGLLAEQRAANFYTPPFGAALSVRSATTGPTVANMQLVHDAGTASTGTVAQIGVNVRADTGVIGNYLTAMSFFRWRRETGSISSTDYGLDLIFANAAIGSTTIAERLRFIAGGGILFPDALTSTATNLLVLKKIPTEKTASFTFDATHAGASLGYNSASAGNGTIPPNSSVAYPIGTEIEVRQRGAGQFSFVAGAGVTFESRGNALKIAGQYGVASALKVATDTWSITGDITT